MTPESKLNFFPQYEEMLKSRTKSATARLGDIGKRFQLGQSVTLTIGWDRDTGKVVANGTIKELFVKRVKEITERDLDGESPDCLNKEALKYVLSSIYRKVVNDDDYVSIIKWRYE